MCPGTAAEERPDDALRPLGTGKHCFTECNYTFLFRKRLSFKSSYQVHADSAFLKGFLLQTQCWLLYLFSIAALSLAFSSATSTGLGFFSCHWFHLSAAKVDAAWASVLLTIFDLLGCRLGKSSLDYKMAS